MIVADWLTADAEILYLLELPLRDPGTALVETRYYGSRGWHARPDDSIDPGRFYSGRLLPPDLEWSLFSETNLGGRSAPTTGRIEILDLEGDDRDIDERKMAIDGLELALRIGTPELDLSEFLSLSLAASGIRLTEDGERYAIELRGLEEPFDRELERPRYWGMGSCLELDGEAGDHVEIPHDPSLVPTASLVAEAVVELAEIGTTLAVVTKGPLVDGEYSLLVDPDGRPRFRRVDDGLREQDAVGATPLEVGVKHRLSGRYQQGKLEILVDGVVEGSLATATGFNGGGSGSVLIGASPAGDHLTGKVDDVRIYVDVERSDEEIERWMHRELDEAERAIPALYLPLDEGWGDKVFDESGAGLEGTITGDPALVWSTLYEGSPDQQGLRKPVALGSVPRAPGVLIDARIEGGAYQLHHRRVRGIGPADEGGNPLRQRMSLSADDVVFAPAAPGSDEPDVVSSALLDFGGLLPGQFVAVTKTLSNDGLYRVISATPSEIRVPQGSLVAEAGPAGTTIETSGLVGSADDLTRSALAGTITTAGDLDFTGLAAGEPVTLAGPGGDEIFTLAEDATADTLAVVEPLVDEAPGTLYTITTAERWDYRVDLERAIAILRASPTLKVAFAVRGDDVGGYVSSAPAIMRRVAEEYVGIDPEAIDAQAFDDLEAVNGAVVGEWIGAEEITGRLLMDRFAQTLGAAWGFNLLSGLLEVARRDVPKSPVLTLGDGHFFEISSPPSPGPISELEVLYAHNHQRLQEDGIAGIVRDPELGDPDLVAYLTSPDRTTEARIFEKVLDRHPLAPPGPALETLYQLEPDAQAEGTRIYSIESEDRAIYVTETGLLPLVLDLRRESASLVSQDFPALEGGRPARPIQLRLIGESDAVAVTWWS